jgi:hypothetical protein
MSRLLGAQKKGPMEWVSNGPFVTVKVACLAAMFVAHRRLALDHGSRQPFA